jgi:hypothetical protein
MKKIIVTLFRIKWASLGLCRLTEAVNGYIQILGIITLRKLITIGFV